MDVGITELKERTEEQTCGADNHKARVTNGMFGCFEDVKTAIPGSARPRPARPIVTVDCTKLPSAATMVPVNRRRKGPYM